MPFRGTEAPSVSLDPASAAGIGGDAVEVGATVGGQRWRCGRDLATGRVWLQAEA